MVPVIAQDDALRHKNSYKVVVKVHALSYPSEGDSIQWDPIPWIHGIHWLSGEIGNGLRTDSQA